MFGPNFTQPQQFVDAWTKLSAEQIARMEQMTAQVQEMQHKALERAFEAIDESARLMKESFTYAASLSDEWRKITLDATKKATEAAQPDASRSERSERSARQEA